MSASLALGDIFRVAGPAWRAAHIGRLPLQQLKVMSAIEHCRTPALGGHVAACGDCGHWRIAYNSWGSRFCSACPKGASVKIGGTTRP
uniref:transposase zinc-binding domain-containing protein n=1 Tax=Novacetimonas hansenii TaxID=436 RepID=UPI001CE06E74|nr:transposase zinc-binding domain-containing protein [Novacetimonas hansenii]